MDYGETAAVPRRQRVEEDERHCARYDYGQRSGTHHRQGEIRRTVTQRRGNALSGLREIRLSQKRTGAAVPLCLHHLHRCDAHRNPFAARRCCTTAHVRVRTAHQFRHHRLDGHLHRHVHDNDSRDTDFCLLHRLQHSPVQFLQDAVCRNRQAQGIHQGSRRRNRLGSVAVGAYHRGCHDDVPVNEDSTDASHRHQHLALSACRAAHLPAAHTHPIVVRQGPRACRRYVEEF